MRWWRAGMRRQMWLYAAVCLTLAVGGLATAQVVAGAARATARELSTSLLPAGTHIEALTTAYGAERNALVDYLNARGTGRTRATYAEAAAQVTAPEADAATVVAGHPAARAVFERLRAGQERWRRSAARPELAAAARGEWARADDIQLRTGLPLSRAVGREAAALRGELQRVQLSAVERVQHEQRLLLAALLGSLAVIVVMVLGTYVALRRNVLLPFLAIGHAVDRVAAGDHRRQVPASGPLELAALGRSVETMRVRLLAALTQAEAAEQNVRRLLESFPDAALQLSEDGLVVAVNAQFEALFGYPRQDVTGHPLERLVPLGLRERVEAHRAAHRAGLATRADGPPLVARHRDGREIPVEVTTGVIPTTSGLLVSASVRDISERLAAQAERERLIAEAEQERYERRLAQNQRLESLGQLVGGVAHDFNNLLNIILGYSTFVTKQLQEPPDSGTWDATREDVEQIHDAAERASRLTHQLLAFGRREVVKPEVVDLNEVVSGLDPLLRRTIGEHIELVVVLEPRLRLVKADPGQLEQVLVNVSVNARDAMTGGGRLTVDTTNVDIDEAYAQARPGLAPGRYVRLRVCDTGTGIDPETMRRVFEPFFTTKPKGQGTGLGLATVYGIVTQAGGYPRLYSEVGLGTTFAALLPATEEPGTAPEPDPEGAAPGHGEVVLLVEDEESLRELIARILTHGGYEVLVADGPPHALDLAADPGRRIDLLLTDVVMPGMLGQELAARTTALRPGLAVVFMSGYAHEVLHSQGTLEPGVELLEKPFTQPDLLHRMRDVLDRA